MLLVKAYFGLGFPSSSILALKYGFWFSFCGCVSVFGLGKVMVLGLVVF
jgi:hypothetical protein